MPSPSLTYPFHNFLAESAWIGACFELSLSKSINHPRTQNVYSLSSEMAVLRLYDAWSRFCREVVIMSAGCRPFTVSGTRLTRIPQVNKREDVIPALMSTFKKQRFEPKWGDASKSIDAAQRLGISNFSTFSAAIGAANSTAEEIRRVRNFFAHRNRDTAFKVRAHPIHKAGMNLEVSTIVGQLVHPGVTKMESWIANLRIVGEAAIQ